MQYVSQQLFYCVFGDLNTFQSLKVRSSYIEQLRNLDIIATHFMPNVLHFLELDQGPLKVFKLDIWAVDEFHVECEFVLPTTRPGIDNIDH
jgi:hypothetical protein